MTRKVTKAKPAAQAKRKAKKVKVPTATKARAKVPTATKARTKATKATAKTRTKPATQAAKTTTKATKAQAAEATSAAKAATKASAALPHGAVALGSVRVSSGMLGIFDIGLVGYMPREALDPAIVRASVPTDRTLPVVAFPLVGGAWDCVQVTIAEGDVVASRKLGEVAVDLGQIACMDVAALDTWKHEDALDGKADVVFWGHDAQLAARILGAKRHAEGYGWADLPVTKAETRYDDVGRKKSANKWQLTCELRPHSHHHQVLSAIAASSTKSTSLELAGTELAVFSASNGVYPVYAYLDGSERVVAISIQLA